MGVLDQNYVQFLSYSNFLLSISRKNNIQSDEIQIVLIKGSLTPGTNRNYISSIDIYMHIWNYTEHITRIHKHISNTGYPWVDEDGRESKGWGKVITPISA